MAKIASIPTERHLKSSFDSSKFDRQSWKSDISNLTFSEVNSAHTRALGMNSKIREFVKRVYHAAPRSLLDQENMMNLVQGMISHLPAEWGDSSLFNLPLLSKQRSFLILSDGPYGRMAARFKATFPLMNIAAGDHTTPVSLSESGYTVKNVDNLKEFPFQPGEFDTVLAMRTLCKCTSQDLTCGGVCNSTLRAFLGETMKVLDRTNPLSIAVLHQGPRSYDIEEWSKILDEECEQRGFEFRYALRNDIYDFVDAIVIKPRGSFDSPEFKSLMKTYLPTEYDPRGDW